MGVLKKPFWRDVILHGFGISEANTALDGWGRVVKFLPLDKESEGVKRAPLPPPSPIPVVLKFKVKLLNEA